MALATGSSGTLADQRRPLLRSGARSVPAAQWNVGKQAKFCFLFSEIFGRARVKSSLSQSREGAKLRMSCQADAVFHGQRERQERDEIAGRLVIKQRGRRCRVLKLKADLLGDLRTSETVPFSPTH